MAVNVDSEKPSRQLWGLDNDEEIASSAELEDVIYKDGELGKGLYLQLYFPSLTWDLSEVQQDLSADENLQVWIEARAPMSTYTEKLLGMSKDLPVLQEKARDLKEIRDSKTYDLSLRIVALVTWLREMKTAIHPRNWLNNSINKFKKKELTTPASNEVTARQKEKIRWCLKKASLPSPVPLVSIVIPYRDEPILLDQCVRSIVSNTSYPHFEIVLVSNDSIHTNTQDIRQQLEQEFSQCHFYDHNVMFNFSKLVNFGVEKAKGEFIVLLNNDIEIQSSNWLEAMLSKVQLADVGIVGGYLSFPSKSIQHLGLHIDSAKLPVHSYKHRGIYDVNLQALTHIPRYVTAVTGAMLMCSKTLWNELDGFDEEQFAVAFNDVDFCLRAYEKGYQSVVQPKAKAIHHESVSRGYESTVNKCQRFEKEQQSFMTRHHAFLEKGDPYFSAR